MKHLTAITSLALLLAACGGKPNHLYYTPAMMGLKGKVVKLEWKLQNMLSPEEPDLDTLSEGYRPDRMVYTYSNGVLQSFQVFSYNNELFTSFSYTYDTDSTGRKRICVERNDKGEVVSETFLVSMDGSMYETETVYLDSGNIRTAIDRRDKQGRVVRSELSDMHGFSYVCENTFGADGELASQEVSMMIGGNSPNSTTSEYSYQSYDEHGNWTKALVTQTGSNGERKYMLQLRKLTYEE